MSVESTVLNLPLPGPLNLAGSALFLDLDGFKPINDSFGHPFGDTCLQAVAQALQAGCGRSTDFVARYGGEEFLLLLPQTDAAGAELFAERIKGVGGLAFTDTAALVAHLRAGGWMRGYCDPVLWPALAPHFGAGFTGGQAFVHDPAGMFERRVNKDTLQWQRLGSAHWEGELKRQIERHVADLARVHPAVQVRLAMEELEFFTSYLRVLGIYKASPHRAEIAKRFEAV